MDEGTSRSTFYIKDCALAPIATGLKAQSATELRDRLLTVHPDSLFYHFWAGRLRSTFEYWEFHNDFSSWAHHGLNDDILAERLEILDPTEYQNIEDLRHKMVEIIDNRLDELEHIPWSKFDQQLYFIRSKIVVFNTAYKVENPQELIQILPHISRSSLFYHFIDARRRTPDGEDDFSAWLKGYSENHSLLISLLKKIDPFFITLADLQHTLISTVTEYFIKNIFPENNEAKQ